MSRITVNAPSLITQSSPLTHAHRAQGLERLSAGVRVNGADAAALSPRAGDAFLRTSPSNAVGASDPAPDAASGLAQITALLAELEGLVGATRNAAGQREPNANQNRVDSILRSIDRVATSAVARAAGALSAGPRYSATNVNSEVGQFSISRADIPEGESLDVEVVVTQSAQVGGFILSFGGASIDLGSALSTFVIEVAGPTGSRELSFASGTSVDSIEAAINVFTDVTGVTASSDGSGRLDIKSELVGSDEFVSLRVIDDGDIAAGDGAFTLSATDTDAPGGDAPIAFSSLAAPITDFGQDVRGTINGIVAEGRGAGLSIRSEALTTRIELALGGAGPNAQNLGSLLAFTLEENARADAARATALASPTSSRSLAPPLPERVFGLLRQN